MAGVAPHRRPLARALRWDGFFPIGSDEKLGPDGIAAYLDGVDRPDGWDLFASPRPGSDPAAYAAVGVTWLVEDP